MEYTEDTKYTQQDTTSFSYRKCIKPKRKTHIIGINTDEVDQEIFSSIEAAQSKLEASNTEAARLEQQIKDIIKQQKDLEGDIADLERENERLLRGRRKTSPRADATAHSFTSTVTGQKSNAEPKTARCHYEDLFSVNIADRMSRSPHRQGWSQDVYVDFKDDDVKRRERAWKQAEFRVPDLSKEVHAPVDAPHRHPPPNRQQVNIKELKAQMGRIIMDSYAPLQKMDKSGVSKNHDETQQTNRLAELEDALRKHREDMNAANIRLRALEEEPFVLYCRRTREPQLEY